MAELIAGAAARRLCKKIKDRRSDGWLQCHCDLSDSSFQAKNTKKQKAETLKLTTDAKGRFPSEQEALQHAAAAAEPARGPQVMEFVQHMSAFESK